MVKPQKHFSAFGAAVLFGGIVPSFADASVLPEMTTDPSLVIPVVINATPEPCVLPEDRNAKIPDCWWEAGWFVVEAGMCAAVAFPPAKATKVAKDVGKAIKKIRKGKKGKGKEGGGVDGDDVRAIMTAIFGGFICADMWSSFRDLMECLFRN